MQICKRPCEPIGRAPRDGARPALPGPGRAGRGAGRVRAPQGAGWSRAGWDGMERHGPGSARCATLAPSLPRARLPQPSQSPLASPVPAARMRPPFHPRGPSCLWRPSSATPLEGSSFPLLLLHQQPVANCIFCTVLARGLCCCLEKSLPRPCFASTRGDTSLGKKLIHWKLHLCS